MMNSREMAVQILIDVFEKNAYSNIALDRKISISNLNEKDNALVTEIVYGTIKYVYTIDKILNLFLRDGIKSLDGFVLNTLRISIYQMRYLDKIPSFAIVDEAVKITKKNVSVGASKLTNGVLRNYLRNPNKLSITSRDYVKKMSLQYSFPEWLVQLFSSQYGKIICEEILKGLNERPSVTVRINSLKSDYDSIMSKLEENGYEPQEGYICPEAIILEKGRSIEKNPLFRDGLITVQDESAMLVAPSMEVEEDMTVLDMCSAPGGKTTHIAEIMNNKGEILAYDIYNNKLKLINQNLDRLGIENVKCSVMNAEKFNSELKDTADRILIDVPCSGLGIIRKKPEIKWNKSKNQLDTLVNMQKRILNNASKYIKVDGSIVYSTCTLNKDENERNVQWFLQRNENFKVEPLFFGKSDNIIYSKEGFATILPNKNMDGFFIAKIKRIK